MKHKVFYVSISIVLLLTTTLSIMNWFNIKDHHKSIYKEYTYAYDCMKEAEITYWDYKCALVNEVQNYITQIAPTSNLRGYAVVEECEKYNVDICFVLAQGEMESHFGTKGVAAKTNMIWNVKAFDNKSAENIIKDGDGCRYPNESIEPYLKLLITKYLINKTEEDLLKKFVDIDGKRYASNPNYEIMVSEKYKFIKENTKIVEYHAQMKNWAIKCNR